MYSRLAILERSFSSNGGKVRSFELPDARGVEPWEDWEPVGVVIGRHRVRRK